jgi:hypothetical protein
MRHEILKRLSLTRNQRFFSSNRTAAAVLLSIAFNSFGVILAFFPIPGDPHAWKDAFGLLSIFLSISALMAAVYWEFYRAVEYVIETTHGGFENRFLMISHDSFEELDARIKRAINIKNTFVDHRNAAVGGTSNPYTFYSRNRLQIYFDFFCTDGKSWIDVVSKTTAFSSPFKFSQARDVISMAARPGTVTLDDAFKWTENDMKALPLQSEATIESNTHYQTFVLKQSIPSTNFVIFEYPDEEREVLWGWGFHGQEPSASVFCSKDDRVVSYFWNLFSALQSDGAENIEDTNTNVFYERRWIGAWVEKGMRDKKPSWAVRVVEFDKFDLLMTCYVLGENGEQIRSYETRNVFIDKSILTFNSESQDRRANIFSETSRAGFGRLKLDIPNDRLNFVPNEFREYRGKAILIGAVTEEKQEEFDIQGRRVHYDMLIGLKGIKDELDISELSDLKHDPEPIYLGRLLATLSKLKNSERLDWIKKTFKHRAPENADVADDD